jgi:outer membrane protein insertion porin family
MKGERKMAIPKNIKTKNYMIIALIFVLFIYTNVWAETGGQSMSTEGISLIAIKTANCTFRISAWERPEVAVNPSSESPTELLTIEKKDDRIEIEASKSAPDMTEFNISIPEDINLAITSMNGSIYLTGINGKKKIETFNGNVEMSDVVGSISAKTFNGNIVADIRFDEKSDFSTVNGSIDIRAKDEFSVPISVNTVSGNITMTLPDGYSAEIDASTLSGQIFNELPLEGGPDGHSLKGKIFNGGPPLKLKTISGTINIKSNQAKPISVSEPSQEQPEKPISFRRATEEQKAKTEETKTIEIDKSSLPIIEAIRTLNPPVIDGRLDDKAWKSAGKIENFVWTDGVGKPFEPTEAYLLWDDQNLYIGVRCYESNMDKIKISVMDNDEYVWADENVQILIDPTPEAESNYYHIAITPIGTVFDMDVKNVDIGRRRTYPTELGTKWNFGGELGTDIRDNSWSIEISIPIFSLTKNKPKEQDIWRFNLHRMEQQRKEYTYWSPTYQTPDWPHVPSRFGKLLFSGMPSLTEASSLAQSETESEAKIVDIIIEGNQNISKDEIMESLKLKIGDIANIDSLSRAKQRLESLGWFQNIGMDLVKNHEGVKLMVNLIEKEIVSPSAVIVEGSTAFSKEELIKYFNLTPAKTTKQDIEIKCKLIPEIYKAREYDMATAKCSIVSNVLNISIDEGRIDKIEISGNKKIKTEEIMKNLNLKPGMPYKRSDINNAISNMRYKLPYFDNVNWDPKRSADGLNIVHIEVKENSLMQHSMQGTSGFDRIHGLQLGFKPEVKSIYWGSKVYFGFSYGFSSEIWNYQFGAEKSWFREHKTTIGVDVHKMTDTNDREIISDKENFVAEAILGEALRDYYQREGYEVSLSQEIPLFHKLGSISVKYRDDEYGSLSKTNDWSLLNRFYADEEYDIDKDVKYKRGNPAILEGRMKSIIGECVIDTRNNKKETTNGWYNTFSMEYAGNELGGDYEFKIYQANIRRYNRISGNQLLALRIKVGTSDRELPRLHPRKFYLGGIGTLRGYDFKIFEGDQMLLMNAEYWLTMGALERTGFGLVLFADSGYAWKYNSEIIASNLANDLKTDVGIGISFGSSDGGLIVNIATPIEEGNREPVISARLNRMF